MNLSGFLSLVIEAKQRALHKPPARLALARFIQLALQAPCLRRQSGVHGRRATDGRMHAAMQYAKNSASAAWWSSNFLLCAFVSLVMCRSCIAD
jgi:hypothetical protein